MYKFLFFIISCFSICSISQNIPTIYATGGMTPSEWEDYVLETKENFDPDGPNFGVLENPCSQGVWVEKASSTLAPQGSNNYNIENINDYNHKTAWVEGKSDYGIGEYFIIIGDVNIIYNGYQKSKKSWENNSRVQKFKVYKNNKPICYLKLNDLMGGQYFELPESNYIYGGDEAVLKFEIIEVYKGERWNDVAVTHIDLQGCCLLDQSLVFDLEGNYQKISKINEGDFIKTIDLKSGELKTAKVNKVFKQKHYLLLDIKTNNNNTIKSTKDHPFYIKDYGFISLKELLKIKKLDNYADLNHKFEILVWNEKTEKTEYEVVTQVNLLEGEFETYTILDLINGNNFIANGFITCPY